jgi:gluconate 2-dehydrogenase gamma chain
MTGRRGFLLASGQALGGTWLALHWPGITAAAMHAGYAAAGASAPRLRHLDADEARDLEAIAAQIIPTDDTPGAREAGAVYFIDAALGGFHAEHRAALRDGYREFASAYAASAAGGIFADATADQQRAFLGRVEATPFFQGIRFLTVLGFLAHPKHGGNRDGIGWQVIGFEDLHAFVPPFGHYDRDYAGFVPYDTAGAK